MVTCTKVKQKPKDGCVHTLQFSAEKALKACDHTRMADIFDHLSALMGLETQENICTYLELIRQS